MLQERVESYLSSNKLPKQGSPWLWVQAFQTIFFFFLSLYVYKPPRCSKFLRPPAKCARGFKECEKCE